MKQLSGEFDELQDGYANKPYDLATQLVDTYSKKWAETKHQVLNGLLDAPGHENVHQQRHADTEDAIRQLYQTMMEQPSIEIIRDQSGRASAIKKGDRIMQIERGPDGKARGLKEAM